MLVFNSACVSLPTTFCFFSALLGKQWESSTAANYNTVLFGHRGGRQREINK